MKATHKKIVENIGFDEVELNPGQLVFGRKKAAQETGLSEQTIRTCLQKLNGRKITIKPTNKYTIITIINWESYQGDHQTTNQQNNQQVTSNQPSSNQQVTTNKNAKNVKNSNTPPTPLRGEYTESFEKFWEQYPKKVGKDAAFKKWVQIGKGGKTTAGELIQAIILQVQSNHFAGSNGDNFIPNPSTWLNQGRWKDEIKKQDARAAPTPTTYSQCQDYEERQKAELLRRSREKENGEQGIDRQALTQT